MARKAAKPTLSSFALRQLKRTKAGRKAHRRAASLLLHASSPGFYLAVAALCVLTACYFAAL